MFAEYPKEAGKRKYNEGALVRRFEQFYVENEEVVAQVAQAFDQADYTTLGKLVDISQVIVRGNGHRGSAEHYSCCWYRWFPV
jgi:galactokinase